jgi:hypothetical protein
MEKKKFEFYFSYFIISFIFGLIVVFVYTPPQKIYVKYPNPINSNKTVYTNDDNECYKVDMEEIECKGTEELNPYLREQFRTCKRKFSL